jgi:hypothetical protein
MTGAGLDRERLAKLLGLLGSDFDAEVAAAGRAADRLVCEAGLRWSDVILAGQAPPRGDPAIAEAIHTALACEGLLTDWEATFVRSLRRQHRPISDRQKAVLDQITAKIRATWSAAA